MTILQKPFCGITTPCFSIGFKVVSVNPQEYL